MNGLLECDDTVFGSVHLVVILVVMITATHYNGTGTLSLIAMAAALVAALLWDINRRRTSWRN